MSIVERIRRIARANIHGILDRVDTPELAVKQKIEELEKAITEAKAALAGFAVTHKKLEREHAQLEQGVANWQAKAEESLAAGDEALARKALAAKLEVQERQARIAPSVKKGSATYDDLKKSIVALNDELGMARTKLAELRSRKQAATAQQTVATKLGQAQNAGLAGIDFERMEEDVIAAESAVEIDREIRGELAGASGMAAGESADGKVDAELAALKKKIDAG